MHHELVEGRRRVSEPRFLHALSFSMLLPGPEAQQLAISVGGLLHGVPGGQVAGTAFVLPGAALMFGLSWLHAVHGSVALVEGLFGALASAVVGIASFVGIWRLRWEVVPVVLASAAAGLLRAAIGAA